MEASQPHNLLFFENFSPICDYEGLKLVIIEPSLTEARVTVSYLRGGNYLVRPLRIKDKRKSWATQTAEKKAREKEAPLLLDSPNFSHEEYQKLGGFLSKKVWEVNIKFMKDSSVRFKDCIDLVSNMIKAKGRQIDTFLQQDSIRKSENQKRNEELNEFRCELQQNSQYRTAETISYTQPQESSVFSLRPNEELKSGGVHAKMNQTKEVVKPRQPMRTTEAKSVIHKKAKPAQEKSQIKRTCDTVKVSKEKHSSQPRPKTQSLSRGRGQVLIGRHPRV